MSGRKRRWAIPAPELEASYFFEQQIERLESSPIVDRSVSPWREIIEGLEYLADISAQQPLDWPATVARGERGRQKAAVARRSQGFKTRARVQAAYGRSLAAHPDREQVKWHVSAVASELGLSESTVKKYLPRSKPPRILK